MSYGLSNRRLARSRSVQRALSRADGAWGGYQAWHQLDHESRIRLVECALDPANDCTDACSVAV